MSFQCSPCLNKALALLRVNFSVSGVVQWGLARLITHKHCVMGLSLSSSTREGGMKMMLLSNVKNEELCRIIISAPKSTHVKVKTHTQVTYKWRVKSYWLFFSFTVITVTQRLSGLKCQALRTVDQGEVVWVLSTPIWHQEATISAQTHDNKK